MAEYIFAYHGGDQPGSPEEGAKLMAKWNAWLDDLGEASVNPGSPLGMSKTVSASGVTDDGGPNPLNGYSIVKASSIEDAIELAKSCPFLEINGSIEVAEIRSM